MVFDNEKQLEKFILKKSRLALLKAQDKVYAILKEFLYNFYAGYDPIIYHRTYQLLQSLVQSRIVSDGRGYKAEVYYNLDKLSYGGGNPSGEQVMAAAKQGLHGAIGKIPHPIHSDEFLYVSGDSDIGIWNQPIEVLDAEAIGILKSMLIAEGIPIK